MTALQPSSPYPPFPLSEYSTVKREYQPTCAGRVTFVGPFLTVVIVASRYYVC